ncbi:MAG: hypothetical protein IAE86_21460 [Burkholderiaceae bacterium]|nr:hypothetical protein [Burkholderiaceae bacterium]
MKLRASNRWRLPRWLGSITRRSVVVVVVRRRQRAAHSAPGFSALRPGVYDRAELDSERCHAPKCEPAVIESPGEFDADSE